MVRTIPLREFLINQINDQTPYGEELKELINNHLEGVARRHHRRVRIKLGWSPETFEAVLNELHKLKPRFRQSH